LLSTEQKGASAARGAKAAAKRKVRTSISNDEVRFDGAWAKCTREWVPYDIVGTVSGDKFHQWPPGTETADEVKLVFLSSSRVQMTENDTTREGELRNGLIHWSDGEVWAKRGTVPLSASDDAHDDGFTVDEARTPSRSSDMLRTDTMGTCLSVSGEYVPILLPGGGTVKHATGVPPKQATAAVLQQQPSRNVVPPQAVAPPSTELRDVASPPAATVEPPIRISEQAKSTSTANSNAEVGDFVIARSKGRPAVSDDNRGNKDGWKLAPDAKAQVLEIDYDGDFRLQNPEGIVSDWQLSKFFEKVSNI